MKLIDRYILRQFFVPLAYCLATFCMIFVIFDLFDHLSDFIEAGTPVPQVVRYYLFLMPSLLIYIVPISLLLGLLYGLWRMTKHHEITAMRASGISIVRLMVPLLIVGLSASLLVGVIQEAVAPWAAYWSEQFIERQKRGDDLSLRCALDLTYKNESQHRIWVIRKFDLKTFNMEGITVVQQRSDGSDLETMSADEGKFYDGRWWFFNVRIQKYDFYDNPVGPVRQEARREMIDWNEAPRAFVNEVKNPLLFSSWELWEFMKTHRNLSEQTYARYTVDMHSRLAMPWTCLVVMFFGIPCGMHTARKGAFMGILAALGTFFGYYMLMNVCQWLGKSQIIESFWSAWLPNLFFALVGLWLMARVR